MNKLIKNIFLLLLFFLQTITISAQIIKGCGFTSSSFDLKSNPQLFEISGSSLELLFKDIMNSSHYLDRAPEINFYPSSNKKNPLMMVTLANKDVPGFEKRAVYYNRFHTEKIITESGYLDDGFRDVIRKGNIIVNNESLAQLVFIINHELAHFTSYDVINENECNSTESVLKKKKTELRADSFAVLKSLEMGISSPEVFYRTFLKETNDECYPSAKERQINIINTYISAHENNFNTTNSYSSNIRGYNNRKTIYADESGKLYGISMRQHYKIPTLFWDNPGLIEPPNMRLVGYTSNRISEIKEQLYGVNPQAFKDSLIIEYRGGRDIYFTENDIYTKKEDGIIYAGYLGTRRLKKPKVIINREFIDTIAYKFIDNGTFITPYRYKVRIEKTRIIYHSSNGIKKKLKVEKEINNLYDYPAGFKSVFDERGFADRVIYEEVAADNASNVEDVIHQMTFPYNYEVYEIVKQSDLILNNDLLDQDYLNFGFTFDALRSWFEDDPSASYFKETIKEYINQTTISRHGYNYLPFPSFESIDDPISLKNSPDFFLVSPK
ncbi:MAG: hypothetical protein COA50_07600 [Flavobacteriaceae bacterium]|nr:MAG: hypothetical protein COA50_07600 [Flavobacteriaceae bacterium]